MRVVLKLRARGAELSEYTYIKEVLKRGYDNILVGYGNSYIGNKVVETAKYQLNQILKEYSSILVEISDESNTYDCSPMHPLFAAMRISKWILKPYHIPKKALLLSQEKDEIKQKALPKDRLKNASINTKDGNKKTSSSKTR